MFGKIIQNCYDLAKMTKVDTISIIFILIFNIHFIINYKFDKSLGNTVIKKFEPIKILLIKDEIM